MAVAAVVREPLVGFEAALWRALAVFRGLALGHAVVAYALRADDYDHPLGGWLVLAAMAAWTVTVSLLLRLPAGRSRPVLALDLALAMSAVAATRLVDDPARIEAGAPTLPLAWAAAPVLAWAARGGWRAGVAAASGVAAADIVHRGGAGEQTVNNIVLLLLAGAVVGYVVTLGRRGEQALGAALTVEAATRERERLARDIHDGVLQVLALVGRRGREIGGDAHLLGELAADQERRLRSLVQTAPLPPTTSEVDLRAQLDRFAGATVTVAAPATPVLLAADRAGELVAAVGAALDNVVVHAGEGARAWVLVEDEGADVVVSVRDDGAGIAAGRIEAARTEGRLGLAASVEGRVRDLGGSVRVTSVPGQGTEVELRAPRLSP